MTTVYAQSLVPIENLRYNAPVTYTPPSSASASDSSSSTPAAPSTKGITLRQAQAEDTTGFSIAQMLSADFVSPTSKQGSIFDILA